MVSFTDAFAAFKPVPLTVFWDITYLIPGWSQLPEGFTEEPSTTVFLWLRYAVLIPPFHLFKSVYSLICLSS